MTWYPSQGAAVGEMPSDGLTGGRIYCGMAAGEFHVLTLLVECGGGSGRGGATYLL